MGRKKRQNGSGSVAYRKDRKSWYIRFTDNSGTRHQVKAEGCHSKKEALNFLATYNLQHRCDDTNALLHGQKVALSTLAERYCSHLNTRMSKSHAEHTRRSLSLVLRMTGFKHLCDVTPLGIEQFLEQRISANMHHRSPHNKKRTVAKRTANHDLTAFKAMLNWAVSMNIVPSNPIINCKGFRLRKCDLVKIRRALSPGEVTRLIDPANSPNGLDLVWATFLGTGLRRGELTRLVWADLDLEHTPAMLFVRSEISKNSEECQLPLHDKLAERLRKHRRTRRRISNSQATRKSDLVFTSARSVSITLRLEIHNFRLPYPSLVAC